MSVPTVEMKRNRYDDGYESDVVLEAPARQSERYGELPGFRFGVGSADRQDENHPYAFGKALVLDRRGGSAAEMEELRAAGLVIGVEEGTRLRIHGRLYEVCKVRGSYEWLSFMPVVDTTD